MRISILAAAAGLLVSSGAATAQTDRTEILDIYKVKIRPDKRPEYEAAVKKMAALNRKNGDRWIAFSTEYGDSGTLYFSSARQNMAEVETAFSTFEKAITAGLGTSGFSRLMNDLNANSISGAGEIRRRRWDLSVNPPASREEQLKLVAGARWIRTLKLELRPSRLLDFVEAWKPWQAALAAIDPKVSAWVSTSVTGPSAVYIALYYKTMAEMDAGDAGVQSTLASDTYRGFLKASAPLVVSSTWEIHRMRPELSCLPDEFIALDPGYWAPKPVAKKPAEPVKPKQAGTK